MFESSYLVKLTQHAATTSKLESDYWQCWQPLQKHFDPTWTPEKQ